MPNSLAAAFAGISGYFLIILIILIVIEVLRLIGYSKGSHGAEAAASPGAGWDKIKEKIGLSDKAAIEEKKIEELQIMIEKELLSHVQNMKGIIIGAKRARDINRLLPELTQFNKKIRALDKLTVKETKDLAFLAEASHAIEGLAADEKNLITILGKTVNQFEQDLASLAPGHDPRELVDYLQRMNEILVHLIEINKKEEKEL